MTVCKLHRIAISVSLVNRNLLYSLIIKSMIPDAALICTSRHFICRPVQTKYDSIVNFDAFVRLNVLNLFRYRHLTSIFGEI